MRQRWIVSSVIQLLGFFPSASFVYLYGNNVSKWTCAFWPWVQSRVFTLHVQQQWGGEYSYVSVQLCVSTVMRVCFLLFSFSLYWYVTEPWVQLCIFSSVSVQQHWAVDYVWVAMRVFFFFSFLLLFLSVRQWAMSTVMRIFFFLSNCTATLNRECSYGPFPLSVQQYSAVSTVPFLKFVQQHWAVSKVTLKKKCTATLSCEYTYACIFQLLFFSSFFCILAATLNRYHSCEWFSL